MGSDGGRSIRKGEYLLELGGVVSDTGPDAPMAACGAGEPYAREMIVMPTVMQALSILAGAIVNAILKETRLMATLDEVVSVVSSLKDSVVAIDARLDEVQVKIQELKDQVGAGGPVTQEQLDSLHGMLSELKTHTEAVQQEAQDLG